MPKILYIEDDELNQDMLSRRLELAGYEVVIAPDGNEGVAMARSSRPDLILMDMSLPGIDGWEATRRIKADPDIASIPVIALTAHAMAGDREKALEAGCDDYDTKPVKTERLLPKIREKLGQPTPEDESEDSGATSVQSVGNWDTPQEVNKGSILIVDDNEDNRDLLSRRLTLEGYEVSLAVDGREALDRIATDSFDLVLLDVMMPNVNGFEVLEQVRKEKRPPDLPIIMVTARDRSEDIVQALRLGANDYVTKPIDTMVLLARVETHMELRAYSKMKDEFLAIASHDLKSPLAAMQGFARLVHDRVPPGTVMDEQYHEFVERIMENTRIMLRIVTDFLDFHALEDGRLRLDVAPIDLNGVLNKVVENNRANAVQKNISVNIEPDNDLPQVDCDEARLEQVIQNFVSNALKFTPSGGSVVVRSRHEDGVARVEVTDTGCGLTDADMQKVFTRYQRLSAKPTGGEKSSGLGLYISKSLIDAHGGEIGVFNNDGGGATFWFQVPIEHAPQPAGISLSEAT